MTEEDDDWFERALTDEDGEPDERTADAEPRDEDGDPDASAGSDETDDEGTAVGTDDGTAGGTDDDTAGGTDDDTADDTDDGTAEEADDESAVSPDDESSASPGDGPDRSSDDGDLFEDDFASAFEESDDPGGVGSFGGGDDGPFGGGDGAAFGGGDGGPFGGGGDDPIGGGGAASAFGGDGGRSGGGDFGMGDFGMGGGGETDFSDEAVESEIDRIDLGIDGLDDMIRGGVPDSSLMAVIGSAGTGKTTFGLQFIQQGLASDERAIYVTLEESRERVIRSAEEKGWPFQEYVAEGNLSVVDMDPIEMANSLSSIRNELPRLVERFGATRLVLDSVSLLEMMYDDRATRRNEIYTFARSLKEAGVTILLTSEADEDNPYASRHGIVEYLTDAVYILQYVRPSDFRETRLAVEIQKIRDAHHSREMKPYEITDEGLSVYRQANIF